MDAAKNVRSSVVNLASYRSEPGAALTAPALTGRWRSDMGNVPASEPAREARAIPFEWPPRKPNERLRWMIDRLSGPPEPTCILWPFATTTRGYGLVWVGGRDRLAHHIALLIDGRPLPDRRRREEVRHLCGVSGCFNPGHLLVGTHAENERDKRRHGTAPIGENHPRSKLSEEQVRTIRSSKAAGRALARQFGVSPLTIRRIRRGEIWSHLAA